jgi:hypothetical protein
MQVEAGMHPPNDDPWRVVYLAGDAALRSEGGVTTTEGASVMEVAGYVATRAGRKYQAWVSTDDIQSELATYVLGAGARHLARWQESGDARRVYLALFGVATQYCEAEKAVQSGYHPDDVAWYAPERIATLVPLALDDLFDGLARADTETDASIKSKGFGPEGGNLMVQVFDVRKALKKLPAAARVLEYATPESDEWLTALEVLSGYLGGDYPSAPGYRRGRREVLSNIEAQQATRSDW